MKANLSPSINIQRDRERSLVYFPTSNSQRIFIQILSNYKKGIRSFNIIGSYGTGKSSFLLAFQKQLQGEAQYFEGLNGQFKGVRRFRFTNLIGRKKSLIKAFAQELEVEADAEAVLKALEELEQQHRKSHTFLGIVIDEFGKFLEYAAAEDPDRELYFIQQLAELCNDPDKDLMLITALHQNFDAYAIGLQRAQRKEWEKVKGRLQELTFNEPVEQLLHLAARFLEERDFKPEKPFSKRLLKHIVQNRLLPFADTLQTDFIRSIHPFDPLSGYVLCLALQRYGQNERSLFSFLQSEEQLGLQGLEKGAYYNLPRVFDYLAHNFYTVLFSRYNPDFFSWSQMRNALERVEASFTEKVGEALSLVKVIGLLDLLSPAGGRIEPGFLRAYAKYILGIAEAENILDRLEKQQIIRFQAFRGRYKIFEGTDVNIPELLEQARQSVELGQSIALEVAPYFRQRYVLAKGVSFRKGAPRIFQFRLTDQPILEFDYHKNREVDGLVNLIFCEEIPDATFDATGYPILYGAFEDVDTIRKTLTEIKAIQKALTLIGQDPVAARELRELKENQVEELNKLINDQLFLGQRTYWYFQGEEEKVNSKRDLNRVLSRIIDTIYPDTPVYHNELMNKTRVSSSIHTAKRQLIEALIEKWAVPALGFPEERFPPEKTIYLTLLANTGIHRKKSALTADFHPPTDESFLPLWEASCRFIASTRHGKRRLREFISLLQKPPFGLKDGFIEFWLITFLFLKREEFALFKEGKYIPRISQEVAELFVREADKYEIKAFNIEGVRLDLFNKYRQLTQQTAEEQITDTGFQATARPFLVFYNQLPPYAQRTKRLSHDALAFRETIREARELEKTFFEDLPTCFGLQLNRLATSEQELQAFIDRLHHSIAELRSVYDELLQRFEEQLTAYFGLQELEFEDYRSLIRKRYGRIRKHLLHKRQKILYNRLFSELPDRKAWLNSLAQALMNKQLEQLSDEEENVLYERLQTSFSELDSLLDLSEAEFDEEKEQVYSIEIIGFHEEPIRKNIILLKDKAQKVPRIAKQLEDMLEAFDDPQAVRAALFQILKNNLS